MNWKYAAGNLLKGQTTGPIKTAYEFANLSLGGLTGGVAGSAAYLAAFIVAPVPTAVVACAAGIAGAVIGYLKKETAPPEKTERLSLLQGEDDDTKKSTPVGRAVKYGLAFAAGPTVAGAIAGVAGVTFLYDVVRGPTMAHEHAAPPAPPASLQSQLAASGTLPAPGGLKAGFDKAKNRSAAPVSAPAPMNAAPSQKR